MKKTNIASILLGLAIIVTFVIMYFDLGSVAQLHCIHNTEWTLGVEGAVRVSVLIYGIIISFFATTLVLLNILKK